MQMCIYIYLYYIYIHTYAHTYIHIYECIYTETILRKIIFNMRVGLKFLKIHRTRTSNPIKLLYHEENHQQNERAIC